MPKNYTVTLAAQALMLTLSKKSCFGEATAERALFPSQFLTKSQANKHEETMK